MKIAELKERTTDQIRVLNSRVIFCPIPTFTGLFTEIERSNIFCGTAVCRFFSG